MTKIGTELKKWGSAIELCCVDLCKCAVQTGVMLRKDAVQQLLIYFLFTLYNLKKNAMWYNGQEASCMGHITDDKSTVVQNHFASTQNVLFF